jgi:lia operon protein LiaG
MKLNALIAPIALIALIAQPQAAHAQRYELTGANVAIYNLAGSIRIEPGTGSNVVVEVKLTGRDANRLTVKTDAVGGVPTLRVIYPGDEIVADQMDAGSETTVRVNDDGTFNGSRSGRRMKIKGRGANDATHAQADLVVRMPAGVRLDAHQAVGDLNAQDISGELSLHSSAGQIGISGGSGGIHAETASGEIGVQNTTGNLDLSSASGEVGVQNATARSISIHVASGSIDVQDAKADRIELETASGEVTVSRTTTARLKASSASGNVRAQLDGDVRDVDLSTASGNAEALVAASFSGNVELETASGTVDVDFPINIAMKRRNHVRGTIGEGGSARVSLSSASGNVKLLKR